MGQRRQKFNPPDSVSLNELRLPKNDLKGITIGKIYFDPGYRQQIKSHLRKKDCLLVDGGRQMFYVMRTIRGDEPITAGIPKTANVQLRESLSWNETPKEIARRFIFGLIEKAAQKDGYCEGEGWQLYAPNATRFTHGYYAVNIGIREEAEYYSVFLEPTTLVLVPLIVLPNNFLREGRIVRKLVTREDKERMSAYDFSTYPGRAGYFLKFDKHVNPSALSPEDRVWLRRRSQSEQLIDYPAFALRIVAHPDEFTTLGLSTPEIRRQMQPLSAVRFRETLQWVTSTLTF